MDEFKSTLDSDPNQWWQTWSVNVRGISLLIRALLLKDGTKQLVVLTSIGAFMPTPGGSGYNIGKLALLRYTDCLDIEYGAQGVVISRGHSDRACPHNA